MNKGVILNLVLVFMLIISSSFFPGWFGMGKVASQNRGFLAKVAADEQYVMPSSTPIVMRSMSGQLHLLFIHGMEKRGPSDIVGFTALYHMYELENKSWSLPQKVVTMETSDLVSRQAFKIVPDPLGIAIYYFQEEFYKKIFDEQASRWLKSVTMLGVSDRDAFLDLGFFSNIRNWYAHTIFLAEDGTLFMVWSLGRDAQKYPQTFIVSRRDVDGSLTHQPLLTTTDTYYTRRDKLYIVKMDQILSLYTARCQDRSQLLVNGTWTNWVNMTVTSCQGALLGTWGTLVGHRYSFDLIFERTDPVTTVWSLQDLGENNHTIHFLPLPNITEFSSPLHGVDVELKRTSLPQEVVFVISIFYETTIELWEYEFQTSNLILMGAVNVTKGSVHPVFGTKYFFNGDLFLTGTDSMRLFWEHNEPGVIREIYSIDYNATSGVWSPVSQVTDGTLFTDDVIYRTPSFGFLVGVIALLAALIFRYKRRSKS